MRYKIQSAVIWYDHEKLLSTYPVIKELTYEIGEKQRSLGAFIHYHDVYIGINTLEELSKLIDGVGGAVVIDNNRHTIMIYDDYIE